MPGKKPVDARAWWNGLNGREASWTVGPPPPDATPAVAVGAAVVKRPAGPIEAQPPKGFSWAGTL